MDKQRTPGTGPIFLLTHNEADVNSIRMEGVILSAAGCGLTSAPFGVNPAYLVYNLLLSSGSCSLGGTSVQTQPNQPDGQRDGLPADGVRCGGETSPPPFLVQRQPASPPNVRCARTPTAGVARLQRRCRPQPFLSVRLSSTIFCCFTLSLDTI